jgi:hypothetical protein
MSKTLDWNLVRTPSARELQPTYRQKVEEQLAAARQQEENARLFKSHTEALKPMLLDSLVNRKPLKVLAPIHNATETMGGITKSEEDDGFYNSSPSESSINATFQEVIETIPTGIELVLKSLNKNLSQWIFKGSNGQEYAVYYTPTIMFRDKVIENPALLGLLHNTNLKQELLEKGEN